MEEITAKELRRALELVPDGYVVHLQGQAIGAIELHERKHSALERTDPKSETVHFGERKTEGTVNLLPDEMGRGPLADKQDSRS